MLWPHQQEAVDAYFNTGQRLFAYDVGLGKTRIPIEIYLKLVERGQARQMLVVCPQTAYDTWNDELDVYGLPRYIYISGKYPQIDCEVSLMSYDIFRASKINLGDYQYVVYDEVHKLKNYKALRTKKALRLARTTPHTTGLSGSTIVKYHEIYTQLEVMKPGFWRSVNIFTYRHFLDSFFVCHSELRYPLYIRADAREQLLKLIKPVVLTYTRDASTMPPLQEIPVEFPIRVLRKDAFVDLGDFSYALMQAGGWNNDSKKFTDTSKLEYLYNLLEENDKPTIIFCRYLHEVEEIHRKIGGYCVTGSSKKDLGTALAHEGKHLVATYCISEALNFQKHYDTMVFYSLPLGYRTYRQAVGRIYARGDATNKVVVYQLLGGWIDNHILTLLKQGKDAYAHFAARLKLEECANG